MPLLTPLVAGSVQVPAGADKLREGGWVTAARNVSAGNSFHDLKACTQQASANSRRCGCKGCPASCGCRQPWRRWWTAAHDVSPGNSYHNAKHVDKQEAVRAQELSSFLRVQTSSEMVVDRSTQGDLLRISFNISFPSLSCEFATLDVSDALGTKRLNLTKTIRKLPIGQARRHSSQLTVRNAPCVLLPR